MSQDMPDGQASHFACIESSAEFSTETRVVRNATRSTMGRQQMDLET
jgi:hypothetical protein